MPNAKLAFSLLISGSPTPSYQARSHLHACFSGLHGGCSNNISDRNASKWQDSLNFLTAYDPAEHKPLVFSNPCVIAGSTPAGSATQLGE